VLAVLETIGSFGGILIAVVVIVGIALVVGAILRGVGRASSLFSTVNDLLKTLKRNEQVTQQQPKSLFGARSIYEPLIQKDFPQFDLAEFITKAEVMLLSVFNAIEAQDSSRIINASKDLKAKVQTRIDDLRSQGRRECFDNARIQNTVLRTYDKRDGRCVITLQSGFETLHFVEDAGGAVVSGSRSQKEQGRCTTDIVYIQDLDKVDDHTRGNAIGVTCPQCGAPVRVLGSKFCEYCGASIIEINVRSWVINDFSIEG
jgi:endogenous inhibitor of DNA gyrase (YacG/DUF329 family)